MTRILIADDVSDNRYLLETLFRGNGFEVQSAANGAEALEFAQKLPPDIVCTDILMPVMDGFELCRRWKSDERLLGIPFVFYTATYTDPKDERFDLSLGADRFRVKPMMTDTLVATIKAVLAEWAESPPPSSVTLGNEMELLRQHNDALFRKLEKKVLQLRSEVAERQRAGEIVARRARQQGVIAELGRLALRSEHLEEVFAHAVRKVAETLGVERCELLAIPHEGGEPTLRATFGWEPELEGLGASRVGLLPQALFTLQAKGPVVVDDASAEARFATRELQRDHGIASGISVVLDGAQRPFGVLAAHCTRAGAFTPDEVYFVQSAAHVLDAAVARVQSEEARRQIYEQLQQSQKIETHGQLVGGITHDFNNILTVILFASAQLVEGLPEASLLRTLAEESLDATSRAIAITRQLLAFSPCHASQNQSLLPDEVVARLTRILQRLLGEHIKIELSLGGAPVIRMDPVRLEQVVLNLALNARHAMPDGGELGITTGSAKLDSERAAAPSVPPADYCEIRVIDTGRGIAPELHAKVFEPFFTTKPVGKGSGLGLAVSRGIVTDAVGVIELHSSPGGGSAFSVLLPAAEGRAEHLGAPAGLPVVPQGAGEQILLVEDDAAVRTSLARLLRGAGYSPLEAHNGRVALELLRQHGPALRLVLTDVIMPELGGAALIEERDRTYSALPVLLLSGFPSEDAIALVNERPRMELLRKPVDRVKLLTTIRRLIEE